MSSRPQGFLTRAHLPAGVLRRGMNLWPPFLGADAIARAKRATARGGRHAPTFTVAIVDRAGATVAQVDKTLHVRRVRQPEAARATAPPRRQRAEA
jgi:hypothetical protein